MVCLHYPNSLRLVLAVPIGSGIVHIHRADVRNAFSLGKLFFDINLLDKVQIKDQLFHFLPSNQLYLLCLHQVNRLLVGLELERVLFDKLDTLDPELFVNEPSEWGRQSLISPVDLEEVLFGDVVVGIGLLIRMKRLAEGEEALPHLFISGCFVDLENVIWVEVIGLTTILHY